MASPCAWNRAWLPPRRLNPEADIGIVQNRPERLTLAPIVLCFVTSPTAPSKRSIQTKPNEPVRPRPSVPT